ncbi:MAG TPA: M23 family metallopeptidase [Candidatus Wallbacteria bacterium]|nr:MAG: Murein hydrolase activator EnvC precursor [bacterium ADurb.Bin243]HPG58009.1 M23 family metallopeptidase [Candidatus Wallbacteria bacterium]
MQISKKAFCFFCVTVIAVCYIFFMPFTNPVTATQSVNLLLEKKFDNSMFIIPDEHFKLECKFKNISLTGRGHESSEKVEGRFQNANLLIAEKVLSTSPDYVCVNSNLYSRSLASDLAVSSVQPSEAGSAGGSELASLIVINDMPDGFSALTSNKLYLGKIQKETYVPGYLRGIDFANYANLHLERDGEEEYPAYAVAGADEQAYGLNNLLSVNFDNPSITESETSLDMSEIDQTADKLPTKDIFKRFSSFKDMNIVVANELEPFEIDCSFLPEKSAPKEFNKFHAVQPKDSVISIAREYNVTASELMAANNLKTTDLAPGSTLLVPDRQNVETETSLALTDKDAKDGVKTKNEKSLAAEAEVAVKADGRLLWPSASRRITSRYGVRVHPVYRIKKFHNGIDIGASYGSAIKAASDGTVVYSGWKSYYGRTVIIKHSNDLYTLYAHCSKLVAKKGERVGRGALIAKVGSSGLSTGPHIHFSVQKMGRFVNPMKYM